MEVSYSSKESQRLKTNRYKACSFVCNKSKELQAHSRISKAKKGKVLSLRRISQNMHKLFSTGGTFRIISYLERFGVEEVSIEVDRKLVVLKVGVVIDVEKVIKPYN